MDQAVKSIVDAFGYVLPEAVLVATACVLFLVAPFFRSAEPARSAGVRHRFGVLTLLALACAVWLWLDSPPANPGKRAPAGSGSEPGGAAFLGRHDDPDGSSHPADFSAGAVWSGPFRGDPLAWFIRGLTLSIGAVLVLLSWNQFEHDEVGESQACLLLILAGINLTATANDLVGLFLALELVSIPTYVLLYLVRSTSAGQEAVLKYFLLSVFSSALLLYGFSFLYGAAGTTNLEAIRVGLVDSAASPAGVILAVALVAVMAGMGFRVTAVPFHFYAPDVFQGTHAAAAALLSIAPKLAGFVVLLRLVVILPADAVPQELVLSQVATPALWSLAVITMTFGNLLALWQTNLRRLLAYSSIAHGGYMLVGLTVAQSSGGMAGGVRSLLFYLAVYAFMTVGAFAVLIAVGGRNQHIEAVEDLAGLSRLRPGLALLLAVFLLSLTGLPPTAGFFGKFHLLVAAWSARAPGLQALAVIMAVNAAIGAAYYLRIVSAMYLRPAPAEPRASTLDISAALGSLICAAVTLALFLAPQWLWDLVSRAAA